MGSENTALAPHQPAQPPDRTPVRLGIAPTSLEEGWRLANLMAKSSLVPKGFLNKPEDVLVAIELGMEVGLAPMQALQSIAVINGRPSLWGDGFLALIMAAPIYQDHDEYYEVNGQRRDDLTADDLKHDTTAAVCTFIRRGKATPVTRRFSIAKAKTAKLWGKEGPWLTYPDRMLLMRARSWAGRDTFPDLLRGIRTAEEAIDEPSTPASVVELREVPREPQRLSAPLPVLTDEDATNRRPSATAEEIAQVSGDSAPRGSEHPPAGNPSPSANADAGVHPPATGLPPKTTAPAKTAAPPKVSTVVGLVTDSRYITKGNDKYFEVEIKSGPMTQVFAVTDEATYQLVSSFEDTGTQVQGQWQDGQIGGRVVKQLISIAIQEPELTADQIFGKGGK